jgi:hypothetical protein
MQSNRGFFKFIALLVLLPPTENKNRKDYFLKNFEKSQNKKHNAKALVPKKSQNPTPNPPPNSFSLKSKTILDYSSWNKVLIAPSWRQN